MRPSHLETRYKHDLSPRQEEVLRLIERGRTNAEIAEALGITLDGAKYHVREILAKLGVESREAAVAAWRSGRTRGRWRWLEAFAASGGLAKGLGLAAAAIGGGAVAAVALVLLTGGGDDGDGGMAEHAPSLTPTTMGATAIPQTTTPGTETALPPCTRADFTATLDLAPSGDDVALALRLEGTSRCLLVGEISLQTLFPPSDPSPRVPPLLLQRRYHLSVAFPFSGEVGTWTWLNWCGDPVDVPWVASVPEAGGQLLLLTTASHPACVDPAAPTVLRDVTISAALGGEALDPSCTGNVAGWLCQFAALLVEDVDSVRIDEIVRRGHPQYIARCDEPHAQGSPEARLCEGATPGEIREGFPLALHGSEGAVLTASGMIARLEQALYGASAPSGARPLQAASVGFMAGGSRPDVFIIALRTRTQPAAVYFAFETYPGREPSLIGAGLSGDNASTILNGGTTISVLGETEFVPLGPQ